MHQSVFDFGFMDYPVFRIINIEFYIRIVSISLIDQFVVKFKNIVFQISLKFQHVILLRFVFLEFIPTNQNIFQTN